MNGIPPNLLAHYLYLWELTALGQAIETALISASVRRTFIELLVPAGSSSSRPADPDLRNQDLATIWLSAPECHPATRPENRAAILRSQIHGHGSPQLFRSVFGSGIRRLDGEAVGGRRLATSRPTSRMSSKRDFTPNFWLCWERCWLYRNTACPSEKLNPAGTSNSMNVHLSEAEICAVSTACRTAVSSHR